MSMVEFDGYDYYFMVEIQLINDLHQYLYWYWRAYLFGHIGL